MKTCQKILSVHMQHGENKEEKYETETHFDEYEFLILYLVMES